MIEINTNEVILTGKIVTKFEFEHEVFGEKFYTFTLESRRLSGVCDYLPVKISERLIDVKRNFIGAYVKIIGQFRSYNKWNYSKSMLILNIFAKDIEFDSVREVDTNIIYIEGYLCKKPVYRKTPLGREIADLIVAVNRQYYKSDYIPTITWGRNARFSDKLNIGNKVNIQGRIQSREYRKCINEEIYETRTVYEVSAQIIKLIED